MTVYRPAFVKQLDGSRWAGYNCVAASGAMLLDRMTFGKKTTTGAIIRTLTGDTSGGLSADQVDRVLRSHWGVDVITGTVPEQEVFDSIASGRAASVDVLYGPIVDAGAKYRGSTTFRGSHQIYVNEVRSDGDYLVYDPLADGRRDGIAKSPIWYPKTLLLKAIRALKPGTGRAYVSFTTPGFVTTTPPPPTPPAVVLKYGGYAGYRGRWRTIVATRFRSSPFIRTDNIVKTVPLGYEWANSQTTEKGTSVSGSSRWLGDATGNLWMHVSVVKLVK